MGAGFRIARFGQFGECENRQGAGLEREHPLCINGANNAVEFECRYSGPKVIIGKGAGGPETATSLLRDLLEIRGKINGATAAVPAYNMSGVGGWS